MLKHFLSVAFVCSVAAAVCRADSLEADLFPLTGEIRLHNTSGLAVPFVYYSIASPSGALNGSPSLWKSISDNYDLSGNGFIDPAHDWSKLSSSPTSLTEGVFSGSTAALPALRSITLGNVWSPALYPSPDLTFTVFKADMSPVTVTTQFSLDGDYDGNHVVNVLDFNAWRQSYGSTTSLAADGNLNGVVDAADYVIWRNHFGQSFSGSGSGSELPGLSLGDGLTVGSVVPEPNAIVLLFIAGAVMTLIARGRAPRAAQFAVARSSARR